MAVSNVNSEEVCNIAVSQAMKHMRPDTKSEVLNVEDNYAIEASRSEAPEPTLVAVAASNVEGGLGSATRCVDDSEPTRKKVSGLKTTISNPEAIQNDKLHYIYSSDANQQQHIPGVCACDDCVRQQEALMAWAMESARMQLAEAVAQATAQAEEAQKSGIGPKPMMVTPYKHNWVIAQGVSEETQDSLFDWEGILSDWNEFWKWRSESAPPASSCCSAVAPPTMDTYRTVFGALFK